jgi:hypothetical protein
MSTFNVIVRLDENDQVTTVPHPFLEKIVTYSEDGKKNFIVLKEKRSIESLNSSSVNLILTKDFVHFVQQDIYSGYFIICNDDEFWQLITLNINKIYLVTPNNLPKSLEHFRVLVNESLDIKLTLYVLQRDQDIGEYQYLKIMQDIITKGVTRSTRNDDVFSLFGEQMRFDLNR